MVRFTKRKDEGMRAENFIKDYTSKCSNELCAVEYIHGKKVISYHEWLTPDQALMAVEIAREEVIEKAVMFLTEWDKYRVCLEGHKEWFIEKFKRAMLCG